MAGKNAAIHDSLGRLRQGVVGVPGVEPRRNACGTEVRVVAGIGAEPLGCGQIGRRGQNRSNIGGSLALLLSNKVLEVGACYIVQLKWKGVRKSTRLNSSHLGISY